MNSRKRRLDAFPNPLAFGPAAGARVGARGLSRLGLHPRCARGARDTGAVRGVRIVGRSPHHGSCVAVHAGIGLVGKFGSMRSVSGGASGRRSSVIRGVGVGRTAHLGPYRGGIGGMLGGIAKGRGIVGGLRAAHVG